MSTDIFFKFDDFQNLYINGATFDIESNVDNLQVYLNTDINCVAYLDVSLHYFNNVFSYAVNNASTTTDISNVIYNGGPDDISYYVDFISPYDISNNVSKPSTDPDTWNNMFIWFNPAYARCPPRSMKNNDITIENSIVHSAYPINGHLVPRIISQPTTGNMYEDRVNDPNNIKKSWEVAVLKNDQIFMENETTKIIGSIEYYTNCLVIRTEKVGIIPVKYFVPLKDIRNLAEHELYNNNFTGNPDNSSTWMVETHSTEQRIERVLSSDRLFDEYIRYVSLCLTNSPNNVGLIANFEQIQKQFCTFCGSDISGVIMKRLKDKLIELDVTTATPQNQYIKGRRQDPTTQKWFVDNSYNESSNITRMLLKQASSLGRGYEITADDILNGKRVPFKFIAGDKITIIFTINPPILSSEIKEKYKDPLWRDFQEILIKPRTYRIFVNLVN
jgi:hypothetical protein